LNLNDKISYKLPKFTDPEGNDVGEVYVDKMENQEWPAFVTYTASSTTIHMNPNHKKYNGRTYYFRVVLKEKNSDYMMNIYYMTIKMSGEPWDEEAENENKTKVVINIPHLDYHSKGLVEFSVPVNMSAILSDFNQIFKVYVNNTLKEREELRDLEIIPIKESKTQFAFIARFQKPYMYGLLNKRNDLLIFECINSSRIVLDPETEIMKNVYGTKRIEMQFDFRGKNYSMTYFG
jgi:hypothetical protein